MDSLRLVINKEHSDVLDKGVEWADKIHLCVAYWRDPAVEKLLELIQKKPKPPEVQILISLNELITEPEALDRLLRHSQGMSVYVCNKKKNIFHPKIYYFEKEHEFEVMVGSANMTQAGIGIDGENEEASVYHYGRIGSDFQKKIKTYLVTYPNKKFVLELTQGIIDNYDRIYRCKRISKDRRVKECLPAVCLGAGCKKVR